jgi:hypothetical protein
MELRTILYGYIKHQFRFSLDKTESVIVKQIFDEYIDGMTLQKIADRLTAEGVVYYKDKAVWNKHMVRRILENRRYAGDEEYPAIVTLAVFERANEKRLKKGGDRESDSEQEKYFKSHTVCEQCGKRFTRQRTWSKTREKWYCTCGCKNTVYIDDNLFYGQILSIINHVIENPEILRVSSSPNECYTPSIEVLRAEKEADRMAERKNVDFLPIKKAIYTNISDKFDCCALDRAKAFTNALEQYFSEQSVSEAINIQILRDTVERIYVNKNGKVIIGFLNGCRISKEDSYGNSSTETKNSY